jgi:hypothetical protein
MQSANGRTKHLPKRGRQLDADLRNAILKAGVSDNRYNCVHEGGTKRCRTRTERKPSTKHCCGQEPTPCGRVKGVSDVRR